jgi:osmotically-inducible protein OsmY
MKWDIISRQATTSFCRHLIESILLSVLATTLLLGCADANDAKASGSRSEPTNDVFESAGAQQPESDQNLAERLRAELQSDPSLAKDVENIRIIVADRQIILTGSVGSPANKQSVEARIRSMAGDSQIDNRLRVVPRNTEREEIKRPDK